MKNEKDEMSKKDKEEDNFLKQGAQDKKKPVAKDLVELKHIEVGKQKVSKETKNFANALKQKVEKHIQSKELSNDEITILESFMGKRLFLNRIAIIVNQSRIPLGIEPFKKAELDEIINGLIDKGYVTSERVGNNRVYYLTEKGREFVQ